MAPLASVSLPVAKQALGGHHLCRLVMNMFGVIGGLSHLLWLRGKVHGAAAFRLIVCCQSRHLGVIICVVAAHQLLRVCIQICARSESCQNPTIQASEALSMPK